jgi:hypothetical protein
MIRNRHFILKFNLDFNFKKMIEYGYGLLNNVYRLDNIPIKNSKQKVKLRIKVNNINQNKVESVEAEIDE